jgi:aryl-alcohol dehydrogenase-like predicted oxidoreductase
MSTVEERGCRDEMVVATKFTTGYKADKGNKIIQSNFGGNNAKGMKHSVEASLKKLKTDYIDLLWVHWWDYSTSIEEVMYALNDLVVSGKVIYLGISDTPAWIVSKANEFARAHHLRPFVVYQGKWSAADRDFERDIIPMCKAENMGLCPWGALGGGNFKTKAQRETGEGRKMAPASANQIKLSEVLEGIGKKKNVPLTSIALAYVMHKTPYVHPIVGGRSIKHLKENIEALALELSDADIDEIEGAIPFDIGFPHNFAARGKIADRSGAIGGGDVWLTQMFGHFDFVEQPRPIQNGLHKAEIENKE